jgi:hypothetical protein
MDEAKLKKAFEVYTNTDGKLRQMEANHQLALRQLKDIAEAPTFNIDGGFYQVRERNGALYLCMLKGKPLGRPKGSKSSKSAVEVADAMDTLDTPDAEPSDSAAAEPA